MSGGHNTIPITPSRWHWKKFKDLCNYYVLLGAIPLGAVVFYANVFVGPATLSEIPEDYEPKHWEYYRHPISRFFARYMMYNPQQEYEKYMTHIFLEQERRLLREVEQTVKAKMAERHDYEAYYYKPIMGKYHRATRESAEKIKELMGD